MSPGAVRRIVIAVCVETLAADVEERVARVVARGAAEEDARDLVRSAVKLGRARA